jgi:hypothetical protein
MTMDDYKRLPLKTRVSRRMIKLVRGLYIRADIHEVATALAALTGEPHPLAGQA